MELVISSEEIEKAIKQYFNDYKSDVYKRFNFEELELSVSFEGPMPAIEIDSQETVIKIRVKVQEK